MRLNRSLWTTRPAICQAHHAAMFCVDHIFIFHTDISHKLLQRVRPYIFTSGNRDSVGAIIRQT